MKLKPGQLVKRSPLNPSVIIDSGSLGLVMSHNSALSLYSVRWFHLDHNTLTSEAYLSPVNPQEAENEV
jgi:hypothetical protein